jgi:hypothetical protein
MRGWMYEAMPSLYVIAGPNGAGKMITSPATNDIPMHLLSEPR